MILVNGDSFTDPASVAQPESTWPYYLGQPVVNLATGGNSNPRIYRTTIEYLNFNKPDIVIINWTTANRDEWHHESGGYLRMSHQGIMHDDCGYNKDLQYLKKIWLEHYYSRYLAYRNWFHQILHLQHYLSARGIKYLFFSGFDDNYINEYIVNSDRSYFLSILGETGGSAPPSKERSLVHQNMRELCSQIDLRHWVLGNKLTMSSYLLIKKFNTDPSNHFYADGHREWANIIRPMLEQL